MDRPRARGSSNPRDPGGSLLEACPAGIGQESALASVTVRTPLILFVQPQPGFGDTLLCKGSETRQGEPLVQRVPLIALPSPYPSGARPKCTYSIWTRAETPAGLGLTGRARTNGTVLAGLCLDESRWSSARNVARKLVEKYFSSPLPPSRELRYSALLAGAPPYDRLSPTDRERLTDEVFATLTALDPVLFGIAIDKAGHRQSTVNVLSRPIRGPCNSYARGFTSSSNAKTDSEYS